MPRADGPFEVLERINENAYKVNLPGDYGVSATFNVADLSPYVEDDHLANLRANSPQQGEDDGEPSMGPHQGYLDNPRSSSSGAKIKEKVLAMVSQATAQPGCSSMQRPGFVFLIAGDPEGIAACTEHLLLA